MALCFQPPLCVGEPQHSYLAVVFSSPRPFSLLYFFFWFFFHFFLPLGPSPYIFPPQLFPFTSRFLLSAALEPFAPFLSHNIFPTVRLLSQVLHTVGPSPPPPSFPSVPSGPPVFRIFSQRLNFGTYDPLVPTMTRCPSFDYAFSIPPKGFSPRP